MKTRLILDTDIGTDVDDALALALCLASPEIELRAVTTVYVNPVLRARVAGKLLRLAGRDDIPVRVGAAKPIERGKPLYWGGHEGRGLLTTGEIQAEPGTFELEGDAIKFLSEELADGNDICIAGVGPYTNLALALQDSTENPREVLLMGGIYDHSGYGDEVDHNIACDIGAARAIVRSLHLLRLTTFDITMQTIFDRSDINKVRQCSTPFTDALATLMDIWLEQIGSSYAHLHDPLALSPLVERDFVEYRPAYVSIDQRGFTDMRPCAPGNTRTFVSVSVRAKKFREWFFDTICSFRWPK